METEIEKIRNNIRAKKGNAKKSEMNHNLGFVIHFSRFLFTIILTLIALILLKKNSEFKNAFYKHVYEENFSFAQVNAMYKKYFGSAIPFEDILKKNTKSVFNEKLTYSKAEAYKDGVKLEVSKQYLVPVLESGMVVFVGEKDGYGNTIIVQQMNGVDVWYSNVTSNVKLYDYIEAGEALGEVNGNDLYLIFKKDGTIQNYEDYI